MPETNLRIQLKIESKRLKPAVSGVHRKRTISKTGKSEDLLKLEQDLQSIEGKLSGLKGQKNKLLNSDINQIL